MKGTSRETPPGAGGGVGEKPLAAEAWGEKEDVDDQRRPADGCARVGGCSINAEASSELTLVVGGGAGWMDQSSSFGSIGSWDISKSVSLGRGIVQQTFEDSRLFYLLVDEGPHLPRAFAVQVQWKPPVRLSDNKPVVTWLLGDQAFDAEGKGN